MNLFCIIKNVYLVHTLDYFLINAKFSNDLEFITAKQCFKMLKLENIECLLNFREFNNA